MPSEPLPQSDSSVQLRILDGGSFMAELNKLHDGAGNDRFRMYNWAFHIYHPKKNRHVLWDVGMEGDPKKYTPWVEKFMFEDVHPVGPRLPIDEQLRRQGVAAEHIGSVLFSHAHWDHCRPIKHLFPNATSYFGPGTKDFCSPGHLQDASSQWDGSFFDPEKATETWKEFEGPWASFGPFEKAMDFFGDGSLFVIQAPGHMPGNLCAAAHVGEGVWILLGSDCCHSREILDGKCEIAVFTLPNGMKMSLQGDIPAAKDTINRIRELEQLGVHVALAHDAQWIKKGSDQVLMGMFDEKIKQTAVEKIVNDERP